MKRIIIFAILAAFMFAAAAASAAATEESCRNAEFFKKGDNILKTNNKILGVILKKGNWTKVSKGQDDDYDIGICRNAPAKAGDVAPLYTAQINVESYWLEDEEMTKIDITNRLLVKLCKESGQWLDDWVTKPVMEEHSNRFTVVNILFRCVK